MQDGVGRQPARNGRSDPKKSRFANGCSLIKYRTLGPVGCQTVDRPKATLALQQIASAVHARPDIHPFMKLERPLWPSRMAEVDPYGKPFIRVVMQRALLWKGARKSESRRHSEGDIAVHRTYHNRQAMSGWADEQEGRKRRCLKRIRSARRSMTHINPGRA